MRDADSKIVTREALAARIAERKQRGNTIVLANGCFDTLHVGHVRYLEGARAEGDVLVVAINSDSGVAQLKGAGRPILPELARAKLVAGLKAVDYVVVFSETNVEALLELLRPDVHAKGTDYTAESVPERVVAERLGVRIAIVGDAKGHSTRQFLEELRKAPHV
jgi:rfaE bifunctional protein nucleotidyltransferase chain/domain